MFGSSRLRVSEERGLALISVIGIGSVLLGLTAIVAVQSVNNLSQARHQKYFEQAIQVADMGINDTLFRLSENEDYDTGEPKPPNFANTAAEKTWVLGKATTAWNKTDVYGRARLQTTPEGQWISVKPKDSNLIYAVSYLPSYADQDVVRVLRAQYDFGATPVDYGIMTGGDLELGPKHQKHKPGSVHANGSVTVTGKGEVEGSISASGSYTPGSNMNVGDPTNTGGNFPKRTVPPVTPRDYYSLSEYDLCPDGSITEGPAFDDSGNDPDEPCDGQELEDDATTTPYRGWTMTGTDASKGAIWTYADKKAYPGSYYIYQGSAEITQKVKGWQVTIMAEATPQGTAEPHCPHVGGDIHITNDGGKQDKWVPSAAGDPFLMIAGRDLHLDADAHFHKAQGLVVAHEGFDLGAHFILTGSVIAGGVCDTAGSPVGSTSRTGHAHISYQRYELFLLPIRQTTWLEL
jgi:hypothetical protein